MKGKLVIIVGIVALLILAAGTVILSKNKANKITGTSKESASIFTSVKDALSKKMTLVCEFSDETGSSVKSYIKNGSVRITSVGKQESNGGQSSDIIMKDKKMYMWDTKTKQGFVYTIPDTDADGTNVDTDQSKDYIDMIDKYKDSCKVSAVDDNFFTPPTDINFQDMSKLIEDMQKYGDNK